MNKQRLPSMAVDVKASQVPQFYDYLGMKLDSVEACKYSQTAGEDTVRVAMDFEPVVDLRDDTNIRLDPSILAPSSRTVLLTVSGYDGIKKFMESLIEHKIIEVTGIRERPDTCYVTVTKLDKPEPQAPPEQLMTVEEQIQFSCLVDAYQNPSITTDKRTVLRDILSLGERVWNRGGVKQQRIDQLMTMEEQREFVEFARERNWCPETRPDIKESQVLNSICAKLVHRLDDRDIENSKSQQAEAPADGSTD